MKPVSVSGLLYNAFYLLIHWQLSSAVRATSVDGASVERRYYHHEVNLDKSKHHDEFFTFVTVSSDLNGGSALLYNANLRYVAT